MKRITLFTIIMMMVLNLKAQKLDEIFLSDFKVKLNHDLTLLLSEDASPRVLKLYKSYKYELFDIKIDKVYFAALDSNIYSMYFELNMKQYKKFTNKMSKIVNYEIDDFNNRSYTFNDINILCKKENVDSKNFSITINQMSYLKILNYDSFDMINFFYSVK